MYANYLGFDFCYFSLNSVKSYEGDFIYSFSSRKTFKVIIKWKLRYCEF